MTEQLSKAEKLARKMHNIISGGQSFNKQVAAQVRDELRRQDHDLEVAQNFAAQMRAKLATARADALREAADAAFGTGYAWSIAPDLTEPGSPYDRGTRDARDRVLALIGEVSDDADE